MTLETGRKVLRITGILTMIGGIMTIAGGIMTMFMGNAAASMPDAATNAELQNASAVLLEDGGDEIISGIITLLEGGASYSAGKNGRHVTAAYVFALLGLVGSVLRAYTLFRAGSFDMESVINTAVPLILSIIIFQAAGKVRRAVKQ